IELAQPLAPSLSLWPPERSASFASFGGKYFVKFFDREPEFPVLVVGTDGKDQVEVMTLKKPNKALEPTRPLVTDRAAARSAPAGRVAHLGRWAIFGPAVHSFTLFSVRSGREALACETHF